jgi:hypothetical protein
MTVYSSLILTERWRSSAEKVQKEFGMLGKLRQEIEGVRRLVLSIKEENGQYVLTKDQVLAILSQYRTLLGFLQKLVEERQRVKSFVAEHRLNKLGVKKTDDYLN